MLKQSHMQRFVLLLLLLSGGIRTLHAQKLDKFSQEGPKFISELTSLFEESRRGSGKDFIGKDFAEIWVEKPFYSADQQRMIYETFDGLLKNRFKPFPEFEFYVKALMAFPRSGKTDADFIQWHTVLNKIMADKKLKKYTGDFLGTSYGLFNDFTFYQSETVKWSSSSKGYTFAFDSIPVIHFPALDIKCYSRGDSSIIKQSKGAYFPTQELFKGTKGTLTWQRAGFDPTKTYAEFNDFELKVKNANFIIDSVVFYNEFFDKPLQGQLIEKVLAGKDVDNATYPRFESYYKRLQIKNIVKNVDYDGGFTMAGTKLLGSGTVEEPALLTFYRENKKMLIASGLEFDIKPERISSGHAAITFLIEQDTIYHPDVNLSFDKKMRQLVLLRSEDGVSKAPFQNTYHNVDMYFEALYWNIDDPLIRMGALEGGQQRYAAFESNTYFKKKRYDSMMGISFNHPLYEIKSYVQKSGTHEFYAKDLAKFLNSSEEQWHMLLIDLNNKGFVEYDLNTHYVKVRPKLYWYIENNIGKRDYDVIQFSSEVSNGFNAQLSLINYDITLKGVENFQLSDSQKVFISPRGGEVVLKKNRDFTFAGRVMAGNFEFMGSDYAFTYEKFQLDLIKVDSCRIYVDDDVEKNEFGQPVKRRVKSVLRDVGGNIRIDSPTNKGGFHSKVYPQYPIFTCSKLSYVYWDNPSIQKGVYKRDKFYYEVKPFVIDSLDNFSKKDLKFEGTLISGGIFPDIVEPLVLMDDYSLGFERNTGTAGLASYGGKSRVTADLKLDYSGLKGNGDFTYLTASASSDEFLFLPDSMLGRTKIFTNKEQITKVEVPKAKCDTTILAFYPRRDNLDITSVTKPIDFFENEANLKGTLHLKPDGMTGKGDMHFNGATLSSEEFKYARRKILADTSDFQLAGMEGGDGLAFKTNNVNANVDFDKRQGLFKSNSGETKIEFPTNRYICYMDQFTWYMDRDEMDLSSSRKASEDLQIDTSEEMKKSNFYSVAEGQDSLNFLSPRAKYDLKKSVLTCSKIQYIVVADSKITPDSGKVVIDRLADMRPLKRAQILSNFTTQYHKIYNADLEIEGRRNFRGSGDYTYLDEAKKEFKIHFDNIGVDSTYQTVASGGIKEEDQFFLSPVYEYYGDVHLKANNKFLTYTGGVKILHNCEMLPRTYFKFSAEVNPEEIYIPVDTAMRDMKMSKLGVGIMVTDGSPMAVYPAFLSDIREKSDQGVIIATGYLYYEKATNRYLIGSKEKIKQSKLAGNLMVLNAANCEMIGDGRVNFNIDLGMVKFTNVGDIKYKTTGDVDIQTTTLLSFPFEESAIKRIHDQLENWPNLTAVDVTKTKYEKGLVEMLGTEKSDKLISELTLNGQLKRVPEELLSTFYFADIKWFWNEADQSFQSIGQIGIASMDKKQVFKYVKGKIEIEKKRGADVFRMYLELDPGTWYYFEYKAGVMNVISSDKEFSTIVSEVKDDKRRFEEGKNKYTYLYMLNKKKRDDFVARFGNF
jgi:hypothetical protein